MEKENIQFGISTIKRDNSVTGIDANDIGNLILEELRFIRKDMKQEIRLIAERIELFFQPQGRIECKKLKKMQNEPVNVALKSGISSDSQIPNDRAKELKAWREKLILKERLESEKIGEFQNELLSKHHPENTFPILVYNGTADGHNDQSNSLMEKRLLSDFDCDDSSESQFAIKSSSTCTISSSVKGDTGGNITRRPVISKLIKKHSSKLQAKNLFIETLVDQNLYKCQLCGKRYVNQRDVKRHMRSHTGERTYSCPTCDKSFIRQEHLKVHMRTHTGERPYPCEFCKKAFSRSGDLKVHIRTHTGEKPYQCEICEKCFVKKSDMKRHVKTHANEGPFRCSICLKVFAKLSTMNRHMKTHFSETDDTEFSNAIDSSETKQTIEVDSMSSIDEANFTRTCFNQVYTDTDKVNDGIDTVSNIDHALIIASTESQK